MKTPEEMAEEWCKTHYQQQASVGVKDGTEQAFLAGYNAGYAAGFEGAMKMQEALIEHLEKQMVEEMYVRMEPLLKEEK